MRHHRVEIAIAIAAVIMIAIGWRIYGLGEMGRFTNVVKAQKAPSALYARLLVTYDKPPLYEEEYRMQDVEGVSSFTYRIRGYDGKQITVTAPPAATYNVSFFFGKLEQDGIWQLVNKPALAEPDAHYAVYVKQLADFQQGQRTVTFTNPQYWATRVERQFHMDLSKSKPSDLLVLESTQGSTDPRYAEIVADFRAFGPEQFRRNVASAQARVRGR